MSDFDDEPPPLIEHDEGNIDENDVSYFLFIKISNQNLVKLKYVSKYYNVKLLTISWEFFDRSFNPTFTYIHQLEHQICKIEATKGQLISKKGLLVFSILPKNERKISAPVG